ncbi:COX assembly mitochondrial protein 2 homolog [Ciona intestinalis]
MPNLEECHTEECNILSRIVQKCHDQHPFGKFGGSCHAEEVRVQVCYKKERIARRAQHNQEARIRAQKRDAAIKEFKKWKENRDKS